MPIPSVSVVLPCHGEVAELRVCLAALRRQVDCPAYEVILVESSGDPAVGSIVAEFSPVTLISEPSGLYPGAARNRGALEAQSEYLAFIDVDCIPEPSWLATAFAALQRGITVVAGAVLDAFPLHPVAASDNLLQFADFSPRRRDGPIPNIPSCNFAIPRAAFHEVGGFVSEWRLGEDGLFSAAAAARWPEGVRFVSAMRVRHPGRRGLIAFWKHQWSFGIFRGRLGSRLSRPHYRRWGRWAICIVPVMGVRLTHLLRRSAQWDPVGLLRILVLLPFLLSGLLVWAVGFRRGCRAAARGRQAAP